jgi:hypothetical protein
MKIILVAVVVVKATFRQRNSSDVRGIQPRDNAGTRAQQLGHAYLPFTTAAQTEGPEVNERLARIGAGRHRSIFHNTGIDPGCTAAQVKARLKNAADPGEVPDIDEHFRGIHAGLGSVHQLIGQAFKRCDSDSTAITSTGTVYRIRVLLIPLPFAEVAGEQDPLLVLLYRRNGPLPDTYYKKARSLSGLRHSARFYHGAGRS